MDDLEGRKQVTADRARAPKGFVQPELPPEEFIFGRSEAMRLVRRLAEKVSGTDIPILIQGEGGVGKELLARWIHAHSHCRSGAFVKVNCAAIPATLFESELFGYEQGAFTGAYATKPGRVEAADNGTLLLDEISEMDLGIQGKVLHFLQDGCFCRIGASVESKVKTRLICCTTKDLINEVESKSFRADLFYRINVVQLRIPPLRERPEDIPALAEYFRMQFMEKFTKASPPIGPPTLQVLQRAAWVGNIRELSNTMARYVLIGSDVSVQANIQSPAEKGKVIPLKRIAREAVLKTERAVIMETLRANRWNRRKTAQALRISYRALIYKIRASGLVPEARIPTESSEGISEPS